MNRNRPEVNDQLVQGTNDRSPPNEYSFDHIVYHVCNGRQQKYIVGKQGYQYRIDTIEPPKHISQCFNSCDWKRKI